MRQTLYTIAGCLLATGPVAAQNYAPWEVISPIPNPTGYVYNNGVQLPAANAIWVWLPTVYGHQTYVDNLCVSADNGTTWQYYGTGYSYDSNNKYGTAIVDFYALDARQAWVINTNVVTGAYTLNQTTTGATGFTISIGQVPGQPRRVRFFDATTGLVLTSLTGTTNLQLYRTADAGQTWQLASGSTLIPTTWSSGDLPILQVSGTHFWLTNKGMLLHSPDAGLTWTFTTLPETFMKLAFRDGQHGLAYGTATG